VARWFVSRAGGFSSNEEAKKNILASRRECAKGFHQLHQIHLCTVEKDHLYGFVLAMTAVNLAESCGRSIPRNFKSHVYALLSLRFKHSFPKWTNFMAR
jgi:hypothetical protein